jgi:hypothetical protein
VRLVNGPAATKLARDQVVTRARVPGAALGAYVVVVPSGSDAHLLIDLTPEEAMTVLAALRQYEPYWPSGESACDVAERLANLRESIMSVIGKIRAAAAEAG